MSYTYDYPRMSVTADIAVVHKGRRGLSVLMVRRGNEPYKGKLCFPGGFADMNETIEMAALRELKEETGLDLTGDSNSEFVGLFDAVNRDPRGRTITALYRCHIRGGDLPKVAGGDDAADADWYGLYDLLDMSPDDFGFDHHRMLMCVYNRYYCEN